MGGDISNLEVVKKICQILKKDPQQWIEFVKDRPGHDRRYAVNWRKINHQLGWKPRFNFKTYLKKTVRWYQENVDWWKPSV
jgi:dTDP-glucose 4,6-dehydratase